MSEYITLLGAESVQRAANTMVDAAERFRSEVANLESVLARHHQFLDDWLDRFEAILTEAGEQEKK